MAQFVELENGDILNRTERIAEAAQKMEEDKNE